MVTPGFLPSTQVLACSVCWGNVQDPVVEGTKLSIVFLLGLTYLLLGGGVGLVFIVRRKALRAAAATASMGDDQAIATPTSRPVTDTRLSEG